MLDGKIEDDPKKTCNILVKQYESAFSIPNQSKIVTEPQIFFSEAGSTVIEQPTLQDIDFTKDDNKTTITELRSMSSAGPSKTLH